MPVGLNKVVPRFVKGHLYKFYSSLYGFPVLPNPDPNRYTILRFKEKRKSHGAATLRNRGLNTYLFINVADNLSDMKRTPLRYLPSKTIDSCIIEEVPLHDLPRYLGAKVITPEFENVLNGKPIYRRKKNKILPPKSS